IPCKFFKNGNCLSGNNCKFSHDISPTTNNSSIASSTAKINIKGNNGLYSPNKKTIEISSLNTNVSTSSSTSTLSSSSLNNNNYNNSNSSTNSTHRSEVLCHFHIQGICRNGDSCKFVHGNPCEVCGKCMLVPGNQEQNDQHITECLIQQEKFNQREQMKHLECGICYDSVVDKGRRFGLLSHCDHIFCLECIREWRGTSASTIGQANTAVRLCPLCRFNSHFIIPADIFVSDEKKKEIIEIYKSKLATIPCKYFNKGRGQCKFSTSCMYLHLNADGSIYKPLVRKVQSSFGDTTLHNNQLGMFMQNLTPRSSRNNSNSPNDSLSKDHIYDENSYEEYDEE
ncbi:hypothetical protein DICPUDRAFT_44314, partial [Dictyostelium purpureum]